MNVKYGRGNKGSLFILQKVSPDTDPDALWASTKLRQSKEVSTELPFTRPKSSIPTSRNLNDGPRPWWSFPSTSIKKKPSMEKKKVCVILPAQLASAGDYAELSGALKSMYGYEVIVTPLTFKDWVVRRSLIIAILIIL